MAHFYLSDEVSVANVGDVVAVTGSEAHHAVTVGRLSVGERMRVGDGNGVILHGTVTTVGADRFDVRVESVHRDEPLMPAIWLAQALAKGDRDELAIQAATELGVDGIIPWAASRSIVKWDGAKARKQEARWASILREASKQSVRSRVPALRPLATTSRLIELREDFRFLVLDPESSVPLVEFSSDCRDLLVVVGPEGGISPEELSRFDAAGASRVSLGPAILRTSTAGPAAITVLNVLLGRW